MLEEAINHDVIFSADASDVVPGPTADVAVTILPAVPQPPSDMTDATLPEVPPPKRLHPDIDFRASPGVARLLDLFKRPRPSVSVCANASRPGTSGLRPPATAPRNVPSVYDKLFGTSPKRLPPPSTPPTPSLRLAGPSRGSRRRRRRKIPPTRAIG